MFESQHSDQIRLKSVDFSRIFLRFRNIFRWRILHIFRLTQTGIWSGKRRKINFAACRSISGRRRSYFSLYFSQNAILCLQQRIF